MFPAMILTSRKALDGHEAFLAEKKKHEGWIQNPDGVHQSPFLLRAAEDSLTWKSGPALSEGTTSGTLWVWNVVVPNAAADPKI